MNLLKKIRKFFDRISKATYYYVTFDVYPDFNAGQGEMCSYIVKASNTEKAVSLARSKAMLEWNVADYDTWLVECVETKDDDLIYN